MKRALLLSVLVLPGCVSLAPDAIRPNIQHISHPLAGRPFGPKEEEDCYQAAGASLIWQRGNLYIEQGLARKIATANCDGFYGPKLSYSGQIGYTIHFKR